MPRRPETKGCAASQPHPRVDIQRERLQWLEAQDEYHRSETWARWIESLRRHHREQCGQITLFGPTFPDMV